MRSTPNAPAGDERRPIGAPLRRLARWTPLVVATTLIAWRAIGGVLEAVGHPGAALDDAYIHFQYARAIAELHPLRFQAGEPISTGATSFLWPALLAPLYAIGLRGEAILWPAWLLSFMALGGLAHEAYALTRPLAGRAAAVGAGAMVLAFGGFVWCAASGMEVVPFAWLLALSTRRACEWAERASRRSRRGLGALVALAILCPLMRPEGALTSIALGAVVAVSPPRGAIVVQGVDASRASALAFLVAAALPNLVLLALTGSATSSTAQVKLLFYDPYQAWPDAALANARVLVGTILDGEAWSAAFVPSGGAPLACAGLAAIAWRGHQTRRYVRAALILLLALSMFVPCLYVTFLWNRLRYLWPFATGWLIGLACLARVASQLAQRLDARAAALGTALISGAFVGALATRLEPILEDVARSASGIDRQQVALGRWAKEHLSPAARIGVNDTGAIAYFGERATFDIVGLTTPTEGRCWVAGPASRLEHYERLRVSAPASLPTHFIVYPEWLALDLVLGAQLYGATVTDATILGGQTMIVAEARWEHLGTGERPWTPLGVIHDAIDVADLSSEAEHDYALFGARDGEQVAREDNAPDGTIVVDGGRASRARDRFVADLPRGGRLLGVARVEGLIGATLRVSVAGAPIARVTIDDGPWVEVSFEVPAEARGERVPVEVSAEGGAFTSFHYWFGAPK